MFEENSILYSLLLKSISEYNNYIGSSISYEAIKSYYRSYYFEIDFQLIDNFELKFISVTKEFIVRNDYSRLSFEKELEIYESEIINFKNKLKIEYNIQLLNFLLFTINVFKNQQYSPPKFDFHLLGADVSNLIKLFKNIVSNTSNFELDKKILVILSRASGAYIDHLEQYHISEFLINFKGIKIVYSNENEFDSLRGLIKNSELIFIIGHGGDSGINYNYCNEAYFITNNYLKEFDTSKLFILTSCSRKHFESLKSYFTKIVIPSQNSNSFEISEMFLKCFLNAYKNSKKIELSLEFGNAACNFFPNKKMPLDID